MFSRFFIDRPIFAVVLSTFIVIAGLAAMRSLPIAQYPEIAPPVVSVRAVYPGASAQVLEQTVAAPLENAINGVERMLYMSSNSSSNGLVEIQVTFDIGTDVDQAALNVNNRVKQAEARLPEEVRRQGGWRSCSSPPPTSCAPSTTRTPSSPPARSARPRTDRRTRNSSTR
jgi:multidrug efflux pump